MINACSNYYISSKDFLDVCDLEENVNLTGAVTVSFWKSITHEVNKMTLNIS